MTTVLKQTGTALAAGLSVVGLPRQQHLQGDDCFSSLLSEAATTTTTTTTTTGTLQTQRPPVLVEQLSVDNNKNRLQSGQRRGSVSTTKALERKRQAKKSGQIRNSQRQEKWSERNEVVDCVFEKTSKSISDVRAGEAEGLKNRQAESSLIGRTSGNSDEDRAELGGRFDAQGETKKTSKSTSFTALVTKSVIDCAINHLKSGRREDAVEAVERVIRIRDCVTKIGDDPVELIKMELDEIDSIVRGARSEHKGLDELFTELNSRAGAADGLKNRPLERSLIAPPPSGRTSGNADEDDKNSATARVLFSEAVADCSK